MQMNNVTSPHRGPNAGKTLNQIHCQNLGCVKLGVAQQLARGAAATSCSGISSGAAAAPGCG